jgi:hypothetical protein
MRKKFTYWITAPLLLTIYTSCVDLSHINTFATASVTSLQAQSSNYSYAQSCMDFDCRIGIYYYPTGNADLPKAFSPAAPCNCDTPKKADQALSIMNQVLSAYLTSLAKLSDSKVVNYNFTNLVNAIDSNSLVSSRLSIKSSDWSSVGKIATILSNDLMDAYRKKKLKDIIKKSDPDFQVVMAAYIKQMQQFESIILENDLVWLDNNYSQYFIDNVIKAKAISPYEAAQVYQDYLNERAKITSYKSMTDVFIAALQKIKDGHSTLAKELDHLSTDDVKQVLNQYSTDISSLVSDFNSLKKTK